MANILVITPIQSIPGVAEILEGAGKVQYMPDPTQEEVREILKNYDAIFTNPNKSKVFLSKELIHSAPSLRAICTASTGTNHIDLNAAKEKGVRILSLTEERETIEKISSTAEHAFALMMAGLRKIPQAWDSVRKGNWDYEPFTGRQVNHLTVGVVGYGRLGRMFGHYAKSFGATVLACDPYKDLMEEGVLKVGLDDLLRQADVISLHVHATPENLSMVNKEWLSKIKENALLVNTARGDIVDEVALVEFLKKNPKALYVTDVLRDEIKNRKESPVLREALNGSPQIFITPHVGGMTREGQSIAYCRAASMLVEFLTSDRRKA